MSPDPLLVAMFSTVGLGIVILFIVHGSGILIPTPACVCGCQHKHHVSAFDWDSDYGDPEHARPDYRKPGSCRRCLCRSYRPLAPS